MKRMLLRRLVLSGVGKPDAVLEFKEGLNVVSGDSDTGKTYAFQCLNYILGATKAPKEIAEAHGYSLITLEFTIDNGLYRLERKIGANKVEVISPDGNLVLNCKHDSVKENNLSRYLLWLLLGHGENIILKRNSLNQKRTLSFRDIVHLCTVAETDIIAETSTFQSIQNTEKTAKKSVLKYIVTGVDDSADIEADDADTENIRRDGVVQFLMKKKAQLTAQIEHIEQDKSYQLYLRNSTLPEMIDRIKALRKSISDYQLEITSNSKAIRAKKQSCFEDDARISEFQKLRQHYVAELRKNGMISSHVDFLTQLPHLACPICNQSFTPSIITPENEEELFLYFAKTSKDLQKKIDDLDIAISDVSARLDAITAEVLRLEERNAQLLEISNKEQSLLAQMSKNIAIIRHFDSIRKSIEIYRQELVSVEGDIVAYSEKVKRIAPRAGVRNSTQYDAYCSSIESVLKSWGFPGEINLSFDNDTLDLYINEKSRSDWGKGYRAFIMSAMVVGLMRYCCENDRPHPGFVIIDSPLVSLKERKKVSDEWINDYMEKSMIEDIHSQDSSRQVIIFENKDLKYDLDYNYVEFSHEGDGRRGFIP